MTTTLARLIAVLSIALLGGCSVTQASPVYPRAEADRYPIGGACGGDGDCASGLFCDTSDPGGMCQKRCATTADCGAGAVCSEEKKCYHACSSKRDCREDYACLGTTPDQFCDVEEGTPWQQ